MNDTCVDSLDCVDRCDTSVESLVCLGCCEVDVTPVLTVWYV